MAEKLSKAERKELAKKVEEDRAQHPKKSTVSGFETIDAEAKKLESEN